MSLSNPASPYRARFHRADVHTDGPGRVQLSFTIENISEVTWTNRETHSQPEAGHAGAVGPILLGYNVFDAQTGLLVMEGEHRGFGGDCEPGSRHELKTEIQLPPEDGNYRVWLSPVQENVAWFYERGSDFIEIELSSGQQGIAVQSVRQSTRARLRLRRAGQLVARAFWYPWRSISRHWSLIFSMVRREILGRYRGSMGGALWTLLHPLLLMAAYYFVFGVVLHVTFPRGHGGFIAYFLCGMLPWLAISEAVGRAPGVVMEYNGFVKRVVFPLEILPVNLTIMGLATELFALLIFVPGMVLLGPGLHWTAAYFPLVLIPQLLLTAGLCWFLAALGIFLRDTGQVMTYVLTIWFFVTPICYPAASLPQHWLWAFEKNPVYTIVADYRAILLEGAPPTWAPLAKLWILSLAFFWLGHAWFFKAKKSFADLI